MSEHKYKFGDKVEVINTGGAALWIKAASSRGKSWIIFDGGASEVVNNDEIQPHPDPDWQKRYNQLLRDHEGRKRTHPFSRDDVETAFAEGIAAGRNINERQECSLLEDLV